MDVIVRLLMARTRLFVTDTGNSGPPGNDGGFLQLVAVASPTVQ